MKNMYEIGTHASPNISSRSCSGAVIGLRSKVSTSSFTTDSDKNAGSVGPRYMPFIPMERRVKRMQTAFLLVPGKHQGERQTRLP